jgi:hypothetical protein
MRAGVSACHSDKGSPGAQCVVFNMTQYFKMIQNSISVIEYIRPYIILYCCLFYLCYMSGGRGGIFGGTLVPLCALGLLEQFSVVDLGNYDYG